MDSRPEPGRPTICLCMIVRNEAEVIGETLTDVAPLIDTWVVVDTGSSDGTREVVRERLGERGLPGELHERPWHDFARNRTEALHLCAGKADYTLVMDADDLIAGSLPLRDLGLDAYDLRFGPDYVYWRRQLFKDPLRWRYRGVVHEFAECVEGSPETGRLEGDYWLVSRRLGHRNRDPDKYRSDARLLRQVLEDDPTDARSVFYLAQSLRDAGEERSALHYYRLRAEMGGWDEEVFVARLEASRLLHRLREPWSRVLESYLACWQARPSRAEPLVELARLHRLAEDFDLGHLFARTAAELPFPESDALFVEAEVYRWRALDEQAICAFYVGRTEETFELCQRLLDRDEMPDAERDRVLANRDFAVPAIRDRTLVHPNETVEALTASVPTRRKAIDPASAITLTMTTCRRPDLFEKTLDSFLHCCEDADRIVRWVVVDDGSPPSDLARMERRYPFLEIFERRHREKGHAHGMNFILETVDTPFWLHLEDDWHFFVVDRYLEKAREILDDDPTLGQVLFNRNYGEDLSCRSIAGGTVQRTQRSGLRYRLHDHHPPASEQYDAYLARLPEGARSAVYWPHYSLRPSLARMRNIRDVGRFDPGADHFELEFAQRYAERGHRSAFLDGICCLHLGPFTWQRGEDRAPNAYDLNDEDQFGAAPSPES